MERDGNGWVECDQGHRHWGVHGAAGLLLHTVDADGTLRLLLQHRADWCHHGGTWGLPGGARDSHESVAEAALREAHEETDLDVTRVRVRHEFIDDHGGWSYTTVYGDTEDQLSTTPNEESAELLWVPSDAVGDLPLHPGFGSTWPMVKLPSVNVIVDSANVVGSVPDGWWADRAGATQRLADRLIALVSRTLAVGEHSGVVTAVHLVIEGKARTATIPSPIKAIVSNGSGDDAIVAASEQLAVRDADLVVVTSDRALRDRVASTTGGKARVHGAKWLLEVLDAVR
ncbi:MAG: NUDIX hydrolase [Actinomycetes bacterium]